MELTKNIIASFPPQFQKQVNVVDLRNNKGRYDDILIVLDRSLKEMS